MSASCYKTSVVKCVLRRLCSRRGCTDLAMFAGSEQVQVLNAPVEAQQKATAERAMSTARVGLLQTGAQALARFPRVQGRVRTGFDELFDAPQCLPRHLFHHAAER